MVLQLFLSLSIIKIAWIINQKNFTFANKFILLIGLISIKCLQSTKFKVKCYRCFINLKFSEFIRKKCDECPSASISFFNHILEFFIGLFEFSLKFLISVHRVTANHFKMGVVQFCRSFIIRVVYLFYYTEFFNRDAFFNFSIFTIINRYFLFLHSWIIFLTSGTLYSILTMSSLFLHSRNRPLKSYYNKTTKRKCVTLSNLKLLLLCFFLFQLLNKIDIRKSRIRNLKEVNTHEFLCLHSIKSMELVEKTELLRRLSVYALSKTHLDRYGSFRKILLLLS